MLLLLALVLLRLLLRNAWVAIGAFFLLAVVPLHLGSPHPLLDMTIHAVVTGLTLFVMLRAGLLALMAMWLFQDAAGLVGTVDPSSWLWQSSLVGLAALALLTVYAAVVALGGRGLLQDEI